MGQFTLILARDALKTRRAKDLLGYIPPALHAITAIGAAVIGIVAYVQANYIDPRAGLAADVCFPSRGSGPTSRPAFAVKQYEVHNPGFGKYDDIEIVILAENRFVAIDKEPEGLDVDLLPGSIVRYNSVKGGVWTEIHVSTSSRKLNAGGQFGIRFVSQNYDWMPRGVGVLLDGRTPIPANGQMPPPHGPMFYFLVLGLSAFLFVLSLSVLLFNWWYIRYRVTSAAEQIEGEAVSEGMNLGMAADGTPSAQEQQKKVRDIIRDELKPEKLEAEEIVD